jgi:hypothetical protein
MECPVLSRSSHIAFRSQAGEKGFDLRLSHVLGMALVVKDDKPDDPSGMGFFRSDAVVLEPHDFPNPVEQLLGLRSASFVDIILRVIHNVVQSVMEGKEEL